MLFGGAANGGRRNCQVVGGAPKGPAQRPQGVGEVAQGVKTARAIRSCGSWSHRPKTLPSSVPQRAAMAVPRLSCTLRVRPTNLARIRLTNLAKPRSYAPVSAATWMDGESCVQGNRSWPLVCEAQGCGGAPRSCQQTPPDLALHAHVTQRPKALVTEPSASLQQILHCAHNPYKACASR